MLTYTDSSALYATSIQGFQPQDLWQPDIPETVPSFSGAETQPNQQITPTTVDPIGELIENNFNWVSSLTLTKRRHYELPYANFTRKPSMIIYSPSQASTKVGRILVLMTLDMESSITMCLGPTELFVLTSIQTLSYKDTQPSLLRNENVANPSHIRLNFSIAVAVEFLRIPSCAQLLLDLLGQFRNAPPCHQIPAIMLSRNLGRERSIYFGVRAVDWSFHRDYRMLRVVGQNLKPIITVGNTYHEESHWPWRISL